MNYFKYLFALVLSVGMVSSVLAQNYTNEAINCIPGVYTGNMYFDWGPFASLYPFEMEVNYKPIGRTPAELIFLVTRISEKSEKFCVSYFHPVFEVRGGGKYEVSSDFLESRGSIGSVSTIMNESSFKSNIRNYSSEEQKLCIKVEFETNRAFTFDENETGYRVEGRSPRSFDELKRICNSLPAQE